MKHCGQNNEEIIHTYDLKFYLNYRSDLLIGVYPLREKNKKNTLSIQVSINSSSLPS